MTVTSNNNTILKTVMQALFPSMYRTLSQIGENIGCTRIDDALAYLVHESDPITKDVIAGEIRREFEVHESFQTTQYGDVPKRSRERTIDGIFPEDGTGRCDEEEEVQAEEVYNTDYEEELEE